MVFLILAIIFGLLWANTLFKLALLITMHIWKPGELADAVPGGSYAVRFSVLVHVLVAAVYCALTLLCYSLT